MLPIDAASDTGAIKLREAFTTDQLNAFHKAFKLKKLDNVLSLQDMKAISKHKSLHLKMMSNYLYGLYTGEIDDFGDVDYQRVRLLYLTIVLHHLFAEHDNRTNAELDRMYTCLKNNLLKNEFTEKEIEIALDIIYGRNKISDYIPDRSCVCKHFPRPPITSYPRFVESSADIIESAYSHSIIYVDYVYWKLLMLISLDDNLILNMNEFLETIKDEIKALTEKINKYSGGLLDVDVVSEELYTLHSFIATKEFQDGEGYHSIKNKIIKVLE